MVTYYLAKAADVVHLSLPGYHVTYMCDKEWRARIQIGPNRRRDADYQDGGDELWLYANRGKFSDHPD